MSNLRALLPAAAAMALALAPVAASADDAANEALARSFYAAFNARNYDRIADIVAADLVGHTGEADGSEALIAEMQSMVAEMSDVRITVDLIAVAGDTVTVVANVRGTGGGMMPADQHIVSYTLIDVWLVGEDRLAELWRAEAE